MGFVDQFDSLFPNVNAKHLLSRHQESNATGVLELTPPPLDPDQPNFSIWAGGFLIHISNSPKLARGVFISYRSVLDLFLTVFPLENPILGVQKPNFFSPAAGSNSGNSPKLEGGF